MAMIMAAVMVAIIAGGIRESTAVAIEVVVEEEVIEPAIIARGGSGHMSRDLNREKIPVDVVGEEEVVVVVT
eukprot:scaffold9009_cov23-Cyclotella_meneghiniana.AAC.2